jgi:hypothetical protein
MVRPGYSAGDHIGTINTHITRDSLHVLIALAAVLATSQPATTLQMRRIP